MAQLLRDPPVSVVLQQFARAPVAGQVKSRLQPALSPEEACKVHQELVLWTNATLLASKLGPVELWTAGGAGFPVFQRCLSAGVTALRAQQGADLGARMQHAIACGLEKHERVLLVGSDCPGITAGYLQAACEQLAVADLVLGPALDGGYVLIGARRRVDAVFVDMPWGAATVLQDSLRKATAAGYRTALLPALQDIDRPEDLPVWHQLQAEARLKQ